MNFTSRWLGLRWAFLLGTSWGAYSQVLTLARADCALGTWGFTAAHDEDYVDVRSAKAV